METLLKGLVPTSIEWHLVLIKTSDSWSLRGNHSSSRVILEPQNFVWNVCVCVQAHTWHSTKGKIITGLSPLRPHKTEVAGPKTVTCLVISSDPNRAKRNTEGYQVSTSWISPHSSETVIQVESIPHKNHPVSNFGIFLCGEAHFFLSLNGILFQLIWGIHKTRVPSSKRSSL